MSIRSVQPVTRRVPHSNFPHPRSRDKNEIYILACLSVENHNIFFIVSTATTTLTHLPINPAGYFPWTLWIPNPHFCSFCSGTVSSPSWSSRLQSSHTRLRYSASGIVFFPTYVSIGTAGKPLLWMFSKLLQNHATAYKPDLQHTC